MVGNQHSDVIFSGWGGQRWLTWVYSCKRDTSGLHSCDGLLCVDPVGNPVTRDGGVYRQVAVNGQLILMSDDTRSA